MCSASSRPTISSASKLVMQQGAGIRPFFAGVGPRALSNGLNSAVFFCFFEALRGVRPGPPYTSPVLFKNRRILANAVLLPACANCKRTGLWQGTGCMIAVLAVQMMQKRQLEAQSGALATLSFGAVTASSQLARQRRPEKVQHARQGRLSARFGASPGENVPLVCISLAIPC